MHPVPASLPATVVGKLLAIGAGLVLAAAAGAGIWSGAVATADPPAAAAITAPVRAGVLPPQQPATGAGPGVPVEYQAPLPLPLQVVRGFDPPSTPFGPGHLGVDVAVPPHTRIRSAGAGVVSFAGPVAGRGVVVVSHPDGVRTEYEPVRPLVRRGDVVQAGTEVGVLVGQHLGCPVAECLHWGARRGDVYIDPLGLLAPLGPVRLLPWDS